MGRFWFFIVIFAPKILCSPRAVDLANLVEPRARTFVQLSTGNSIVDTTSVVHYCQVGSLPLLLLFFFKVSSGGLMLLWSIVKITARFSFFARIRMFYNRS